MAVNVYELVTQRVLEQLEKDVIPWRKTWKGSLPMNYVTRKQYRGVNLMMLPIGGEYLSFNQCTGFDILNKEQKMFNLKTIPLIKTGNEAKTEDGKFNQLLQCAMIDAYTNTTAELDRFITKLYQEKNPNASLIYNTLKPLREQQNQRYDETVEFLNNTNFMDKENV